MKLEIGTRFYPGAALALLGAMLECLATSASPQQLETVFDIAQPTIRAAGAPTRSDVCFSSRWKRPNTFESAAAFHASRLDWLHERGDAAFVAEAKAKAYSVNCAVNSTLTDSLTGTDYTLGRALDLDGQAIVAPWMVKWGMAWGCSNHPDYRRIWFAHAKRAVDAGADSIQMDGPSMGAAAVHWGGCFCSPCVSGFSQYLADHTTEAERDDCRVSDVTTFDYAAYLRELGTEAGQSYAHWRGSPELRVLYLEFQRESTLAFFRDMHAQLNQHAGRDVAYSCNNAARVLEYLHEVHDFCMAEWYPARQGGPDSLYLDNIRPAQALGVPMIFTYVSTDVQATRRFIALTYALGSQTIVPWDVYTGSDTPRVFSEPEQYSDLYGFVRANAGLLDGYEDAAVTGPGLDEGRYGVAPPMHVRGGSGEVYASVRCQPGRPSTPVAIHLVDASATPEPFTLVLNPRRFGGGAPLKVELRTPAPYDASAHASAEEAKSYAHLSRAVALQSGHRAVFEIPALSPWAIVVVEVDDTIPNAVWQPSIWATDAAHYRSDLVARMACATEGSQIRYTLDGSDSTAESALYAEPIRLMDTTRIRARAFAADGQAGETASAPFTRLPASPAMTPDADHLREGLALWLHADGLVGEVEDGETVPVWRARFGPDAEVPSAAVLTGGPAGPPTFVADGINGKPVVRFDGDDQLLAVPGFAREHLAGSAFTVLMVTRSDDNGFGVCGNALNGSGGVPRLYLTRRSMTHNALTSATRVSAPTGAVAITSYAHDGGSATATWLNGALADSRSDMPVTAEFGGGHLAFPFWSGGVPHAGDMAELIVFSRRLPDTDREAIEAHLADRYDIRHRRKWLSAD